MASVYTNAGRKYVIDKLNEVTSTIQNRIGWGTGAGTALITDTTLFTEAAETRATATITLTTTTVTGDTYNAVGTLTATSGKTITNAGLFDAATSGVMMLKGDHAGVPLLTGDSIEYTFVYQQT